MSPGASRVALWLLAIAALPVPILLLGPGWVPPAQIAELGVAALAFGLAERLRGVVGWTALIFLGQALVYAVALWLVAGGAARHLGRLRGAAVVLAAALVAAACLAPIYHTPYHAQLAHPTLLEVYR